MAHLNLLRRAKIFRKNIPLTLTVAVAASGAGLLYLHRNNGFSGKFSIFSNGTFLSKGTTIGGCPVDEERRAAGRVLYDSKSSCGCSYKDCIATATAKVAPAVVRIFVAHKEDGISKTKCGSGTIIDSDGTILTCAHLFGGTRGRPNSFTGKVDVVLPDGRTFVGVVSNADLYSDIATVEIKSESPLPTAKLSSSSRLRPGDWVMVLGCPRSLPNSVTAGIVSCVNRKSVELRNGGMLREYIQVDCATNRGNSGGPLINIDGEVVGVHVKRKAPGISFSVPIDSALKILMQFKKDGRVVRPWLGFEMCEVRTRQLKEKDSTFPIVTGGILVHMVMPGSPAARAGICPGDVVIKFNGKPTRSISEIFGLMEGKIGVPLELIVKRASDQLLTFTIIPEAANPEL